jgi:hypothetical protein
MPPLKSVRIAYKAIGHLDKRFDTVTAQFGQFTHVLQLLSGRSASYVYVHGRPFSGAFAT